jgi:hypothetical protein
MPLLPLRGSSVKSVWYVCLCSVQDRERNKHLPLSYMDIVKGQRLDISCLQHWSWRHFSGTWASQRIVLDVSSNFSYPYPTKWYKGRKQQIFIMLLQRFGIYFLRPAACLKSSSSAY